MANYYATARSNYFAVKDEMTFRQWAEFAGLKVLDTDHKDKFADGIQRFALTPDNGDGSGWPTLRYNGESEDYDHIDIRGELVTYLKDGEVAVLMEVGNEKLRYLCGYATAVNSKGETASLSLDGIYRLAAKLGTHITRAEY